MLEVEIETYLLRVVPDLGTTWIGTAAEEVAQIEKLAGCSLPPFYRWFLAKMGRSMGTFSQCAPDLSVATVLSAYAQGQLLAGSHLLMIGHDPDPIMPMYYFYDLDRITRDDAAVLSRPVDDTELQIDFETLREMLAWSAMLNFEVNVFPQRRKGVFNGEGSNALTKLQGIMTGLGFTEPVPTGSFCGLFERSDVCITCFAVPGDRPPSILFFHLGAADESTIRRVLGAIATDSSLTVEIDEPEPPISG